MVKLDSPAMNEFLGTLRQLNGVEICAVAKMLGIQVLEEDGKTPISGEKMVQELVIAFAKTSRVRRRRLMKILKQAAKETKTLKKNGEVAQSASSPDEEPTSEQTDTAPVSSEEVTNGDNSKAQ